MASCSDDILWKILDTQFCSFKIKTPAKEAFCRNEYNVTGRCTQKDCPLANSRYATVRRSEGRMCLFIKTAERQHLPNKWWQRIVLSRDESEALQQIETDLQYWPRHLISKCRARVSRLFEILATQRRLAVEESETTLQPRNQRARRKEKIRERKALVAARLEKSIEKELLNRLKSGAYGEQPLNVSEEVWKKVMGKYDEQESEEELETDDEDVVYIEDSEDDEALDMEDLEKWLEEGRSVKIAHHRDSDSDSDSDRGSEDAAPRKRHRPHIEVEYEEETNIAQAQ